MRAVVAIVAALLSGCALLRPDAGESQQVRDIVADAVGTARATPQEQRRRLAHAQQMFSAVPDDENRVRLAALLATLPPPWRDDARAAGLLEPLAARSPDGPVAELAGLLAASLAERHRLARELRAAELRVEAAQRRVEAAERRAEASEQRVEAALRREEAAAERAGTLQRQVDALKAIERGILEREERRRKQQR